MDNFNAIVSTRFPGWESDLQILLEDGKVLNVHREVLKKLPALSHSLSKNSAGGFARMPRIEMKILLNLLKVSIVH